MSKKEITNVPASILQRLKNYSDEKQEDYGLILSRYAIERLLYRLSKSKCADQFVLKGAQLFHLWADTPYRPTRDVDLLKYGYADVDEIVRTFQDICRIQINVQDGIEFLSETVRGKVIRDQAEYNGIRIKLKYCIGSTGQFMQIDVGFGDAVTPPASEIKLPSILNMPSAILKSYSRETVVAEKVEAMVSLGIANSRMKDFFDVYKLSQDFSFDGKNLRAAIESTFARRKTVIPGETVKVFTKEFSDDPTKRTQWKAFLRRTGGLLEVDFEQVIRAIADFVTPVFQAISNSKEFNSTWKAKYGWRKS
jgi:predicted nucleotidyltransferase component of viral defense system